MVIQDQRFDSATGPGGIDRIDRADAEPVKSVDTVDTAFLGSMATPAQASTDVQKPPEATVLRYVGLGFQPRPVPFGDKVCRLRGWPELSITASNLPEFFPARTEWNVALQTGSVSGGLVAVDFDSPEAAALAPAFLPPTGMRDRRDGKSPSHWFYRAPGFGKTAVFKSPHGMLFEIRGESALTLVPPSQYEKYQERLEWEELTAPGEVEPTELRLRSGALATACLLSRIWPPTSGRHDFNLALVGFLLSGGVEQELVERIVRAAAEAAADEEADSRVADVTTTAARLAADEPVTGRPRLEELVEDRRAIACIAKWLGIRGRVAARSEDASDYETVAGRIIAIAEQGELFHTPEGEPFATLVVDGRHQTWPVGSREYRELLSAEYHRKLHRAPSSSQIGDALNVIRAKAKFEGSVRSVHTRVALQDGTTYLDLGDESWSLVALTPSGWGSVTDPPIRFRRTRATLPLALPSTGGSLDALRRFVNVGTVDEFRLLIAAMTAALRGYGPFPILVLNGEQGSAKSTTARVVRALIDPAKAPLRPLPRDERDLIISATNSWFLSFDNLSGLPGSMSDALCRLSTGGGFSTRALYTDAEEAIFEAQRPVLVNGIDDLTLRGDFTDRAIVLILPTIPPELRRTEEELWRDFEAEAAALLGALLDAVVSGLRELPSVELTGAPRMADFAKWGVAVERGLGWPFGSFLAAYEANRRFAAEAALEADPIALAVVALMDAQQEWRGRSSELMGVLKMRAAQLNLDPVGRDWPRSPNKLSSRIRRVAPLLRQHGISVETGIREGADGKRIIEIRVLDEGDKEADTKPTTGDWAAG